VPRKYVALLLPSAFAIERQRRRRIKRRNPLFQLSGSIEISSTGARSPQGFFQQTATRRESVPHQF
jgi:hypothetical protein